MEDCDGSGEGVELLVLGWWQGDVDAVVLDLEWLGWQ